MYQTVVALRYDTDPVPNDANSLSTRPELGDGPAAVEQIIKGRHSLRRHKILRKPSPIIAIMVTQQGEQLLFGVIGRRLLEVVDQCRPVPPAHFVIGEIADAVGIALVRGNQAVCPGAQCLFHRGVKGVEPMIARLAPQLEVWYDWQLEPLRMQ